jgi:hypothetical protein
MQLQAYTSSTIQIYHQLLNRTDDCLYCCYSDAVLVPKYLQYRQSYRTAYWVVSVAPQ